MIGEATVIAVAAALYLADCVVLLERGQAVLEAGWRRVALGFGSRHYQISGKAVALLNPLTPFVPAFRTLPLFSDASGFKPSGAVSAVRPLAVLGLLQFLLVFVALPICLYRAPGWPFFISLILAYLNATAMLVFLVVRFRKASIPARPLIGLGFGWLACLPLSVNCLRSAGLSFRLGVDAARAIRFLAADEKDVAREALAAQVGEAMQELDESDARHRRLADLKRQLTPEAGHGRA
ncbi:MAG: hypothetical protein AB1452_14720 [Pseudomonadota bacterium]